MSVDRRDVLGGLLATGLAACAPGVDTRVQGRILPPTAGDPDAFLSKCIRCFRCGVVCTAGCIEFHPSWADPKVAGSPYIEPRTVACNACMACTHACPSGALTPVSRDDAEEVLREVDMGTAYVDEALCLSFLNRVCGVCHDACPFPTDAIVLEVPAKPKVMDACIGCGRCEERCPQVPAAIRVFTSDPGPRWTGPEVA